MKRSYSLRSPQSLLGSRLCSDGPESRAPNISISLEANSICSQPQRKRLCYNSRAAEMLARSHGVSEVPKQDVFEKQLAPVGSRLSPVRNSGYKPLVKLYGEGEADENLNAESGGEIGDLLRLVDAQIASLPSSLSVIGLRQLQHILFQLNAHHCKYFQNDDETFQLFLDTLDLSSLKNKENSQKTFIVLFEIYRYAASKTSKDVSFKSFVLDAAQSVIGQCDDPIKLQKFLQNTFLEWYLNQPCQELAVSFISHACVCRPDIVNGLDLSSQKDYENGDDSEEEKENVFYSCHVSRIPICEPDDSCFIASHPASANSEMHNQFKVKGTPEAMSLRARKRFSTRSNMKFLEEESRCEKAKSSKSKSELFFEAKVSEGSKKKSVVTCDHLWRQRNNSSTNRLQSRMLQRSLSQNASTTDCSKSSIATDSKLATGATSAPTTRQTAKGPKSKSGKRLESESVGTKKRDTSFSSSLETSQKRDTGVPRKSQMSSQRREPETSQTRARKRLLTKKVLETPGFKLCKSTRSSSLSNCGNLSSLGPKQFEQKTPEVRETPLHKMPRGSCLEVSKIDYLGSHSRTSLNGQNEFSTKNTNGSFYSRSSSISKCSPNKKTDGIADNHQIGMYKKRRMTPIRYDMTISPFRVNGSVSPYSIVFERDQHGSISALITPAKVRANFSDNGFELSDDSVPCKTPLAGFLNKLSNSAKKFGTISSFNALSFVDAVEIDDSSNNEIVKSAAKNFGSPILNIELCTSTKKLYKNPANQHGWKAVRKSLFASNGKSPKKFTAKSSFHDDDAPKAYQTLCDNSNSIDILAELCQGQTSTSKFSQSSSSRFGSSFRIMQNTCEQPENISSTSGILESDTGSLSFHLRRKLSNLGEAEKTSDHLPECSPSPVHEFPALSSVSNSTFSASFSRGNGRSKSDDRLVARRKAIEDLLQNPMTALNK